MTIREFRKHHEGEYPSCTTLGGYTLIYLTRGDSILCADCAKTNDEDSPEDRLASVETYDEGPPLYCDACSCEIESSYGDPDEEVAS